MESIEVGEPSHNPTEPFPSEGAQRRPAGLWLLTVVLLASPVIHGAALAAGRHWLNYGSRRPWDGFVYFAIAPLVGFLMLRRHERARFSVYVFLSCEILRAVRIHSLALGVLAVGALLYLQLQRRGGSTRRSTRAGCWRGSGCDAKAGTRNA